MILINCPHCLTYDVEYSFTSPFVSLHCFYCDCWFLLHVSDVIGDIPVAYDNDYGRLVSKGGVIGDEFNGF